jgi:hypothetical protein
MSKRKTYSLLENEKVILCQGVGLGDHRDEVDSGA